MSKDLWKLLMLACLVLLVGAPLWAQSASQPAQQATQPVVTKPATATHHMSSGSSWVKEVQQALKDKGNDPGEIDGHMGHKTVAALKEFQKANGLKETGKVDKETAEKLGLQMPTHHSSHSTKTATESKPH